MSNLNARMDNFIGMLLDVSGRARPSDLQGVDLNEAANLLREYAAAHPEARVGFDGEALVVGASGSAPAPAPVPDVAAAAIPAAAVAAASPESFEFGPADPFPSVPQVVAGGTATGPDTSGQTPVPSDFMELPPLEGIGDASEITKKGPSAVIIIAVAILVVAIIAVAAAAVLGYIELPFLPKVGA